MPILDAVVWEFLKTFGQDLIMAVRNTAPSSSIEVLNNEIANLRNYEAEFDRRRNVANNIYRRNSKRPSAKQEFNDEMDEIEKEERAVQLKIKEKESLIKQIQVSMNRRNEIEEAVELYEKDKTQIRNIIREFVKEIVVVYSDIKYMVIDIKSLLYYVTNATDEFGERVEGEYYAIVDKHDNHRIRYAFSKKTANFVFDTDKFIIAGKEVTLGEYSIIFKNIMEYNEMLKQKGIPWVDGAISIVEEDHLKKLDVYQED